MYEKLYLAAEQYPQMKAGFIHVPFLPEQIAYREDKERLSSMPLEDMVTALQEVLEVLDFNLKTEMKQMNFLRK